MRTGLRFYDAVGARISTSWTGWQAYREGQNPRRDIYAGYSFPGLRPFPRWNQAKDRYRTYGGGRDLNSTQPGNAQNIAALAHWQYPKLHIAPEGAVSASLVVEVSNDRSPQYPVNVWNEPFLFHIGGSKIAAASRYPQGEQATGVEGWYYGPYPTFTDADVDKNDIYRLGELAIFPAIKEPRYEAWNVQPGQWAAPVRELEGPHATATALDADFRSSTTVEVTPALVTVRVLSTQTRATKPQLARPMQDLDRGGWTNQDGESTFLWDSIDEAFPPNDEDFVQSPHMPVDDAVELAMTRLQNPDRDSEEKYLLRYRYRRMGAQEQTVRVDLLQGSQLIATWTDQTPKEFVTGVVELSREQALSITDFADLRIRLVGSLVSA
jgi:hypothetical protein